MLSLSRLFSFFSPSIAIDLGTANILVYVPGRGLVLDEPSVIAMSHHKGTMVPYAFGAEAKMMLGKTPSGIVATRPLKDGVIADFTAAEEMIKHFIRSVDISNFFLSRPLVVVCVPNSSTPVERRAIQESVESAGARDVYLIEEPMAAAIGAGLPVTEPSGSMIVDIGGGTTEVGVISLGGVVYAKSIRVGGDTMDETIVNYVKKEYNLLIGESTAEKVKKSIEDITNADSNVMIVMKGRDLSTGIPSEISVSMLEISDSLKEPVSRIIDTIRHVLELSPPELSADIMSSGVFLSGGGALLGGIDKMIHKEVSLPVYIAEDALKCVVMGVGKVLENFQELRHVLFKQV